MRSIRRSWRRSAHSCGEEVPRAESCIEKWPTHHSFKRSFWIIGVNNGKIQRFRRLRQIEEVSYRRRLLSAATRFAPYSYISYPATGQDLVLQPGSFLISLSGQFFCGLMQGSPELIPHPEKTKHGYAFSDTGLSCRPTKMLFCQLINRISTADAERHVPCALFLHSGTHEVIYRCQPNLFQIRSIQQRKVFNVGICVSDEKIKHDRIPQTELIRDRVR